MKSYRIRSNCIMDTSDSGSVFHERGEREIVAQMERIKRGGGGDCLISLSGGVNSSFVTYPDDSFPRANAAAARILSLPTSAALTEAQQQQAVSALAAALAHA